MALCLNIKLGEEVKIGPSITVKITEAIATDRTYRLAVDAPAELEITSETKRPKPKPVLRTPLVSRGEKVLP